MPETGEDKRKQVQIEKRDLMQNILGKNQEKQRKRNSRKKIKNEGRRKRRQETEHQIQNA